MLGRGERDMEIFTSVTRTFAYIDDHPLFLSPPSETKLTFTDLEEWPSWKRILNMHGYNYKIEHSDRGGDHNQKINYCPFDFEHIEML